MDYISPYINKDPLSNLDKDKISQLTPQQISFIQSLNPNQVKALNKQPFGQWKNLSPDSLKAYANKLPIDRLTTSNDQLNKIKNLSNKKLEDLRNANNPKDFLKDQVKISSKETANALISLALPLLTKFINTEKVANLLINKLINDTKKQLQNKGRFVVINGAITFTPIDNANYQKYKDNFDRRVSSLKKTISILKSIIDTLLIILRIARVALTAFKTQLLIKEAKQKTQSIASSVELSSPSPAKPITSSYILDKEISQPILDSLKDKIKKYEDIINFLLVILPIFQNLINTIKRKVDELSFTISTSPSSPPDLLNNQLLEDEPPTEIDYDSGDKQYTIKVITTLSGALQAVAYDKFSRLKITQTAPSKIRGADELINELKQILG